MRAYCSSVVAICGSNGFHPCLSVFIGGCNLWFHWCLSAFIRVHQWLQSVVPLVSIRVYPCSSVVAFCGSIGFRSWFVWFRNVCWLWSRCVSFRARLRHHSLLPVVCVGDNPTSSWCATS